MADVPKPTPVEGWGQERNLGQFDFSSALDEAVERHRVQEEAARTAQRLRSIVALILLSLGAVALLVAVTALLSWPWALLVFGMMCIIVSFMIGMGGSAADKRGQ